MHKKSSKDKIKSSWRRNYSFIIPTLAIIAYLIISQRFMIGFVANDKLNSAIDSAINFLSISIGLFSLLLTTLLGMKDSSKMISYFFAKANKKAFSNAVKYNIVCGLSTILISIILLLQDPIGDFRYYLFTLWLWVLISYCCSTYRFISIMLNLFLTDIPQLRKKEDRIVIGARKDSLDKLIDEQNK